MNGESLYIKDDNLNKLKSVLPELFSDDQLDLEKLKAHFGDNIVIANERYTLNWAGKSDAFNALQQPTTATLKPAPEESINFDTTGSDNIEFFFKLPFWFKINTPIGTYNPDWAVVFKGEKKIYFVAETKGRGQELRGSEKLKIKCGEAHFAKFEEIIYKRVSSVSELNS